MVLSPLQSQLPMKVPVNFDSVSLDGIMNDWLCALQEHSVEAITVLGPNPFGDKEDRIVLTQHPPRLLEAAVALAESRDLLQNRPTRARAVGVACGWRMVTRVWCGWNFRCPPTGRSNASCSVRANGTTAAKPPH